MKRIEWSSSAIRGKRDYELHLDKPRLWWPRTHGKPELYQLEVSLKQGKKLLDKRSVPFGIRQVRPVLFDPESGEKRFRFDINGQPIFLRGADLAPVEGMTHCWDHDRAVKLLDLMELGRMNVLRIWGEETNLPGNFTKNVTAAAFWFGRTSFLATECTPVD